MLYLATGEAIPRRSTRELSVENVEPKLQHVRQWFSLPQVSFVGAHTGCSCGFPSVVSDTPVHYFDGFFDSAQTRTKDLESVRALFVLLNELLASAGSVELLPVWAGDEAEPPIGTIEAELQELEPETFFFSEYFLYRISHRSASVTTN